MSTNAKVSFDENWETIEALMILTGASGSRTQRQIAAQNQAALSFCITAWEAYVEDVAKEAATYLAENCSRFSDLPSSVRKSLVSKVVPLNGPSSKTISGKNVQDLMDDGWRPLLIEFVTEATYESNFNTPNSKNISKLFKTWVGVDVTQYWYWQNFAVPGPATRLDRSIAIRGSIVHTGQKPDGINRNWIETYGRGNICRLVEKTDISLMKHVNEFCPNPNNSGGFGEELVIA
ncbi:HEPN domain-containing protein [Glutamicibacter sp. MNS18]|uniref:HEPN domain-containing protein n=1 Tax=Glutamicibacter sp. MNS18 TaxID=2989817 RepID=UPI002236A886|nr:HEPN domain-containing protein [Glutamicibacter sp. MNS18]MCW4466566.1 HEPN domain-containing protein [Glutamicibacter sp. MNS18]